MGQQGEIIGGGKPSPIKSQGHEIAAFDDQLMACDQLIQVQSQSRQRQAVEQQAPPGHIFVSGPQDHASAQTMQHTEIDDDRLVKAQTGHIEGYGGADHAAAEDNQAPADAVAAQGDTNTAEQDEDDAAPILDEGEPAGIIPLDDAV